MSCKFCLPCLPCFLFSEQYFVQVGNMTTNYRCFLCGLRNTQEGQWQHWFVNPDFVFLAPADLCHGAISYWLSTESCYLTHSTVIDPRTRREKVEAELWFHICHSCLTQLCLGRVWHDMGGRHPTSHRFLNWSDENAYIDGHAIEEINQ